MKMKPIKKLLLIMICSVLLLSSFSVVASQDKNMINLEKEKNEPITSNDFLDQSQEICTVMSVFGTYPGYYPDLNCHAYQSFVPQLGKLTRIEVLLADDPYMPPFKNVNLVIREDLNGENLTKATVSYNQIPPFEDPEWIEFDFPDIQVNVGHTYYMICYVDWLPYGNTMFAWGGDNNNPYSDGRAGYSDDGGENWYYFNDKDRCFRTYGSVPELEIGGVKGGFGKVSADITNNLDHAIENIDCTITVNGGIFNKINVESSFTIDSLDGGETLTISSDGFIFGFGPVVIRFTVECDEAGEVSRFKNGVVILFLVISL